MDLGARVRELEDRREIADLIHAYCHHFDLNEPDAVAALFTEDATVDYGPEFRDLAGREDIRTAVAAGLREIFAATSHHVSNVMVSFEGPDEATSVCHLYAWHRYRSGAPDGEIWARYRHRLRRTAEGWRIARLVLQAAGTKDFHRAAMHPIGRR